MKVLPILQRELRVSSRLTSTYWARFVAGVLAAGFITVLLLIGEIRASFSLPLPLAGNVFFEVTRVLGTIAALSGGIFLTTDGVTEERRQGTLPLLLLTGLSGFDLAVGKVFAALLRGGQWLLAALPVVATSLLLGGVSGLEFLGLGLALANVLFWSIALSLLASSLCRTWSGAFLLTLMLLVTGVLAPLVLGFIPGWGVDAASPLRTVLECRGWSGGEFWKSMASVHVSAWVFLALAGWRIARLGQENPDGDGVVALPPLRTVPIRENALRAPIGVGHRPIQEANPIRWLASRDSWITWLLNACALVVLVFSIVLFQGVPDLMAPLGIVAGGLVGIAAIIYLAAQGSRFFAEAAQNGMLELLVISPLSRRELIAGPMTVMRRGLLIPVGVVLGLQLVQPQLFYFAGVSVGGGSPRPDLSDLLQLQVITSLLNAIVFVIQLMALPWLALLLGIRYRRPVKAFLLTIVLGWLGPSILLTALRAAGAPLVLFSSVPAWVVGLTLAAAGMALHLTILFLSRHLLYRRFDELASAEFRGISVAEGRPAIP